MEETSNLTVSPAPHIRGPESISEIMRSVIIALLPATLFGVYYFGLHALLLVASCVISAILTEAVWEKIRGTSGSTLDGSAALTGLLVALVVPGGLPIWMGILGSIVSISLGKQIFGGLGFNFFNPALVGRAFLMASFPKAMTTWDWEAMAFDWKVFELTSGATPLASQAEFSWTGSGLNYVDLFLGKIGGCIGETSVAALVIGFLYLLYKGYADWRIPTAYLGSVALLTTVLGSRGPIFHLLAGGVVIGALFMATDMVTTPVTKNGRWIFGLGCGFLTVLIRIYGGYPEGTSYAILLMNMFVPLIDQYTLPQVYGEVKANG
ncbi:RnfABCDGE type electron transport complex subunit D [Halanaerobacter jeridensis]|uniref:Ion-translocating oxidoreductase complex subunit D n=1 Tax=Halanaerobacter jeridensis TaxID=706427 RepID=A0A938XR95_9FIRM|nr:RnfABCDGE type electron transport complex subunit D [Halanaerobacter jeridensis]MBM7556171.1 electron transport complex protein RnfD [Halanaerobacter jeridensis]